MWFSCWFKMVTLSNTSTHLSLFLGSPFGAINLENNTKWHFSMLPISYILSQLLCNRILLQHIYVAQCDEQSKSNTCSLVKWSLYCQTDCPKGIVFILCKGKTIDEHFKNASILFPSQDNHLRTRAMETAIHFMNDSVEFYKWSLTIAGENLFAYVFLYF